MPSKPSKGGSKSGGGKAKGGAAASEPAATKQQQQKEEEQEEVFEQGEGVLARDSGELYDAKVRVGWACVLCSWVGALTMEA